MQTAPWLWLVLACAFLGCSSVPPLPTKAVELNRRGALALQAGDYEAAEARLALAIEYSPRFTEAWVNLGLVELARGDVAGAKRDLKKARSLNPDLPTPHHALGLLDEREGKLSQAERSYRAALEVDPGFAPARSNLGRLLFAAGRYEEAREQFERLTEVAPEAIEGWVGLVESFLHLGRVADADHATARARARFGDRPEVVMLVARQMLRRAAWEEAEAVLSPLTEQHDARREASAWAWIGVARLGAGHPMEARAAAHEALLANPDDPVAAYVARAVSGATLRLPE